MSQTIIFGIGVGILLLAVFLAIWLADGNTRSRTFRTKQGLKVDVSGIEGSHFQSADIVTALEEALSQSKSPHEKHS